MTAINVFFTRDRAFVLTDTAFYTNELLVLGFTQKVFTIPTLNAAVALRGAVVVPGMVAQDLAHTFKTLDEAMDGAEYHLDATFAGIEAERGPEAVPRVQIIFAGWSKTHRKGVGFCYDTTREEGDRFCLLDESWCAAPDPAPAEYDLLVRRGLWTEGGVDPVGRFDPVRHGIPFMEGQRRTPIVPLDSVTGEAGCIIGGDIVCTEISADGIGQRVIHSWGDEAYENIVPADAEPLSRIIPAGLSRQQRRKLERDQRRVSA